MDSDRKKARRKNTVLTSTESAKSILLPATFISQPRVPDPEPLPIDPRLFGFGLARTTHANRRDLVDEKFGYTQSGIFHTFFLKTTAHGLQNISHSRNRIGQCFWALVFCGCFTIFCLVSAQLISRFSSRLSHFSYEMTYIPGYAQPMHDLRNNGTQEPSYYRGVHSPPPTRITVEEMPDNPDVAMSNKLRHFSEMTTAHGVKRISAAHNLCASRLWAMGLILCVCLFISQAYLMVKKFQSNEKITNIELKFDAVEFPAITFCNLNPYRKAVIRTIPSVADSMQVYENAKSTLKKANRNRKRRTSDGEKLERWNRETDQRYEPIEAHCRCVGKLNMECIRFETPPRKPGAVCICTIDHVTGIVWPCFNRTTWYDHSCPACKSDGICYAREPPDDVQLNPQQCKCRNQQIPRAPYCLATEKPMELPKLWTGQPHTSSTTNATISSTTVTSTTAIPLPQSSTQSQRVTETETIKAMGFEGMSDPVAMLTRAKENLLFAIAELTEQQRISLSQTKLDFIEMCSFNGRECNIIEDFKLHVDPEYGNCYTFNYDVTNNYTSSRAGPMFGIRVLLFINVSDYMATSESSGVRISVHGPTAYPFPDTFGYSAPVGFISSFGLKKQVVKRLPHPYGDCISERWINSTEYIYSGYDYHPEGCHRSCFQNALLKACDCGDPRFPVPAGFRHCTAFNASARSCLENAIAKIGDFDQSNARNAIKCECKQSCRHDQFSVTFSASKWPSGATDIGNCEGMTEPECEEYYRKNAAMIEIFYEQLNYELLRESEAYGWVNLIADFGGHLGLWMGFSVITCMEIIVLIFDLISLCCHRRKQRKEFERLAKLREKLEKEPVKGEGKS